MCREYHCRYSPRNMAATLLLAFIQRKRDICVIWMCPSCEATTYWVFSIVEISQLACASAATGGWTSSFVCGKSHGFVLFAVTAWPTASRIKRSEAIDIVTRNGRKLCDRRITSHTYIIWNRFCGVATPRYSMSIACCNYEHIPTSEVDDAEETA